MVGEYIKKMSGGGNRIFPMLDPASLDAQPDVNFGDLLMLQG
jgi:hypothetical protein